MISGYEAAARLSRAAARLKVEAPRAAALPALIFVTDPARQPDPIGPARDLPKGTGVLYRHFGRTDARAVGAALALVAREHGLILLVAADPAMAAAIDAHGVHWPERLARSRRAAASRARPGWRITTAAHGRGGLTTAADLRADAAFLSPAFPSRSPSAGAPLGPIRFAALARTSPVPVYALGGVTSRTARRLFGTGAAGAAAAEGLWRREA